MRVRGQDLLARAFKHFPGSYSLLLDPLTALLQRDPAVSHEQFKVTTQHTENIFYIPQHQLT